MNLVVFSRLDSNKIISNLLKNYFQCILILRIMHSLCIKSYSHLLYPFQYPSMRSKAIVASQFTLQQPSYGSTDKIKNAKIKRDKIKNQKSKGIKSKAACVVTLEGVALFQQDCTGQVGQTVLLILSNLILDFGFYLF